MIFSSFFDLPNKLSVIKSVGPADFIDIFLIAYIIYIIAKFFKDTRSMQVLWGIFVIIIVLHLSEFFKLNTVNFILTNAMQVGFVAVIVLFQNELRSGLSKMGRSRMLFFNFEEAKANDVTEEIITAVVDAARQLSERKIGALIVIENNIKLDESMLTGTMLNAEVSSELLVNIFYPKAPLHDGAVVIADGKIASAGCILPLSQDNSLDSALGTRHRAGIGITEISDCVTVIVSEETGRITFACNGGHNRNLSLANLEKSLRNMLTKGENGHSKTKLKLNLKHKTKNKKAGGNKNG